MAQRHIGVFQDIVWMTVMSPGTSRAKEGRGMEKQLFSVKVQKITTVSNLFHCRKKIQTCIRLLHVVECEEFVI